MRICIKLALAVAAAVAAIGAAEIRVAAAADLAQVQQRLGDAYLHASGVKVSWVNGASGVLAKQAENGAPFDILLSANESYVRDLTTRGVAIPDTFLIYATGRLGLWSKSGKYREMEQLVDPAVKHVAIANPAHAPYGLAAKQALESLGIWRTVEPNIVYAENVRQALQFGESGNAEAVLTAWALVYEKPGAVLVKPGLYQPIRQAGTVLQSSRQQQAARSFLRFLVSAEGRRILTDAGFGEPR